jgi:hypothetical protein
MAPDKTENWNTKQLATRAGCLRLFSIARPHKYFNHTSWVGSLPLTRPLGAALRLRVLGTGSQSPRSTQQAAKLSPYDVRVCAKSICRINRCHVQELHRGAEELVAAARHTMEAAVWLLGHVRRMPWHHLPRKLLTLCTLPPKSAGPGRGVQPVGRSSWLSKGAQRLMGSRAQGTG